MKTENRRVIAALALSVAAVCGGSAEALTLTPGNVDVVIPRRSPGVVAFAADEMTNFLSRVLGAPVPIRNKPDRNRVSIVLGTNMWSVAAGVDLGGLFPDGYVMKTVGKSLYIAGEDDPHRRYPNYGRVFFRRGTMNGVYAFLEKWAGCRFYFPHELGEIAPRKKSIELPALDVRDEPAMEDRKYAYHSAGTWFDEDAPDAKRRRWLNIMRLRLGGGTIITCHGLSKLYYVKRFRETHPEYFCLLKDGTRHMVELGEAKKGSQTGKLCFTSGIREEIYQDVKAYLSGQPPQSRGLEKWGRSMWDRKYVGVQPADGYWPCQCEKCQAAYRKGDPSYATELIWGLTKELSERLAKDGFKDVVLMQSAYSAWKRVPDFDLPANISMDVANRGPWGTKTAEGLEKDIALLRSWTKKLGHGVLNWTYPGKYGNANTPRNEDVPQVTPHAYAKYYKAAAPYISGRNAGTYAETCTDRWLYDMINVYVFSRVTWDPSVDADAILDEHYRLMYGAAAPQMKEFFETLERKWMQEIQRKTFDTSIGPVTVAPSDFRVWADIYSPKVIAPLAKLFDKAESAVPRGSIEARRIALMRREFLARMEKRAADMAAELSGDARKELARRASAKPENLVRNFKPVTITIPETQKESVPFKEVKIPVELLPGCSYRLSFFVKGKKIAPFMKRGGAQAVVWFNEKENKGNKGTPRTALDGTFDLVHQSCEFHVPKRAPYEIKPSLGVRLFHATGTAVFENLLVERIKRPSAKAKKKK